MAAGETQDSITITENYLERDDTYRIPIITYKELKPLGIVIFAPAMGVKQVFYGKFLTHLAAEGYTCISFDYKGMGKSSGHYSKKEITIYDWLDDIEFVVRWCNQNYSLPLIYMCHSFGGQVFGLLPEEVQDMATAVVTINSNNGYWRFYRRKYWFSLMWYIIIPALYTLFGHFPGSKVGFGADLPLPVIKQWRKWCMTRHYLFSDETISERVRHDHYKGHILAIGVSDDEYALDPESMTSIHEKYSSAEVELRIERPESWGKKAIGHFGFFRISSEDLWCIVTEFLQERIGS